MRASRRFAVSAAALLIGAAVLGWSGGGRAERPIYSTSIYSTRALAGPSPPRTAAGNLYGVPAHGGVAACSTPRLRDDVPSGGARGKGRSLDRADALHIPSPARAA